MSHITLKCVATGRKWGEKIEESEKSLTVAGVKCVIREFDTWDGGSGEYGKVQQYFRWTVLDAGAVRNDWHSRCAPDAQAQGEG